MVWPIFPLIVYQKWTAAAAVAVVLGRSLPAVGLSSLWAFLLAPILTGLYLRFVSPYCTDPLLPPGFERQHPGALKRGEKPHPSLLVSRENYEERRAKVEAEAGQLVQKNGTLRMWKATASNTFRHDQIDARATKEGRLDLSSFRHVIQDTLQAKTELKYATVEVEASAPFEAFVEVLLAHGYMPLCVPELRTITVGGAIVGIGIESSSFRHGFFHEGLVEADILLGSGKVVTANASNQYKDLFAALPNSLGSFGYLLRLTMRVQRVEPVVKVVKTWHDGPEKLVNAIEKATAATVPGGAELLNDFVDAVALSDTGGMLIEGRFVPETAGTAGGKKKLSDYSWRGASFYTTLVNEGEDYMSVHDYLWRWDPDWFWCTQIFPGLGNSFVRYLMGPFLLRSDQYKIFNDRFTQLLPKFLTKDQELVIQDIEVPVDRSAEWIKQHCRVVRSEDFGKIKLSRPGSGKTTVPIWLCPVKGTTAPLMPMDATKMYINFGFWDAVEDTKGDYTRGGNVSGNINKALEALCDDYKAIKTLYSTCYFTETEFYSKYNGILYKQIKQKYDPEAALRGWYTRLRGS